jgi:hypothetical protein
MRNKMNYYNIKKGIDNWIYFPISLLLLIGNVATIVLNLLKIFQPIIIHIIFAINIIQLVVIITLYLLYKENKSIINLYEGLANETISFVIKFIVNQKSQINNTKVDEADLYIEVVNIPQQIDDVKLKTNRYDLKFIWTLKGKNTIKKDLDKVYFKFGCDNVVKFSSLNFNAFHCQDKTYKNCINNVDTDCSNCNKYKININNIINKTNNYFNLPLEFNKAIRDNEEFIIKVTYIWPKCYNALLDYIIIDPKNFSNDLGKFSLTIKNDKNIINESSYIRLHWYSRSPSKKSKLTGIETLSYNEEENVFKSGSIQAENTKIYILELKGIVDS